MKLPNAKAATVAESKVTKYLLSTVHPQGKSKAKFFISQGFQVEDWKILIETLKQHAKTHEVCKQEQTPYGVKYVVEGIVSTPSGKTPTIRSVWFISTGEQDPKLVTAYPL